MIKIQRLKNRSFLRLRNARQKWMNFLVSCEINFEFLVGRNSQFFLKMNEFIHPIGPHQPDFTVIINRNSIKSNRAVISQLSPFIKDFFSRKPNEDEISYDTNDFDSNKKILLDSTNKESLSCLFLGLNFQITESNYHTLEFVSQIFRISPLSKFLREMQARNSQIQSIFQDSQELKELINLEDQVFSLNDQNFPTVFSFIENNIDKYGQSTINRLFVSFYISRFSLHPLFYSLIEKVSALKLNAFFFSSNSYFSEFKNELRSLQSYLRSLQPPEDDSDEQIITMFVKDDINNFQKYIENHNFKFNMKLKEIKRMPSLLENHDIIEAAAFYGSAKIFNYLVMNKANYNSSIAKFAIAGGNFDVLHFLETSNPKVSFNSQELLTFSIYFHRQAIFEWLIETKEVKFKADELFESCLMVSNFKSLEYIIENIINFNTFSQFCFKSGNFLLLKVLSNIECLYKPIISKIIQFPKSKNVLFKLCKHHFNELFSFLLSDCISQDKFILFKILNENGQNLLHCCCKTNNFKALQTILSILNRKENILKTYHDQKIIFLNQVDFTDFTPLKVACDTSSEDCIELLLDQPDIDPNIRQPIFPFLDYSNLHLLEKFLNNPRFSISSTPKILQKVIDLNLSEKVLNLFLEYEKMTTDVVMVALKSILDSKLYTNLHFQKMVKTIDLTYQNKKGNTILHKICKLMINDDHIECLKLIVSINSNLLNIQNFNNDKPVFLLRSSPQCLDFILNHKNLKLTECELKKFVDIFKVQARKRVDVEDARTFVDDDVESTDSYSDPPPLLRDEDIPGISLVSSDDDEGTPHRRVHISHPHRNDEDYEEDEEEDSMSSFIDDENQNETSQSEDDSDVQINPHKVYVVSDISNNDESSESNVQYSDNQSTVGSQSYSDGVSQSISQSDLSDSE